MSSILSTVYQYFFLLCLVLFMSSLNKNLGPKVVKIFISYFLSEALQFQLLCLRSISYCVFLKILIFIYLQLRWIFIAVQAFLQLRSAGAARHLPRVGSSWLWLLPLQFPVSRAQAQQCGTQAWLLHSLWDLSGPGIEPMPSALAGRFLPLSYEGSPLTYSSNDLLHSFLLLNNFPLHAYTTVYLSVYS